MTTEREHGGSARAFRDDEAFARSLDAEDPLARFRDRFHIPRGGRRRRARLLLRQLAGAAAEARARRGRAGAGRLGAPGGRRALQADDALVLVPRDLPRAGARLVGARPGEVVMMNSLTVNLHLMLATFYRPDGGAVQDPHRSRAVSRRTSTPSQSHAADRRASIPAGAILERGPRAGESALETDDVRGDLEPSAVARSRSSC